MKASPFVKECIIVAAGRKYVAAPIQIDFEAVGKWAESRRLAFTYFRSLVVHIRKLHLLTRELDHDDGEVTATMKVRRSSICKTYADEIEALF